jgi:hypothetical protein
MLANFICEAAGRWMCWQNLNLECEMRSLMTTVSKVLFYLLAIGLLAWTASLTLAFVGGILPELVLAKYFALVVFDVGCVSWLLIFLFAAEGTPQRSTALIMAFLDLIGVGLMVFAELFTGGQQFASIPADLASIALYGIGIWTIANLVGVFAYHFTDPATMQDIARRNAADKIASLSMKMLDSKMDAIANGVANDLAEQMKVETLLKLSAGKQNASKQRLLATANKNGHQETETRTFDAETSEPLPANPTKRKRS